MLNLLSPFNKSLNYLSKFSTNFSGDAYFYPFIQ